MKVLAVVEDNADNRLLVRAILGDQYHVREYVNGADALAAFTGGEIPDVVLMDISLPGINGIEVLASMRADEHLAHLPVVALTAHAMDGDRAALLDAGFDEYVAKPIFDESVLVRAVERALRRAAG